MERHFVPCSLASIFESRHVRAREGRTLIVGSRVYDGKSDRRKRYRDVVGVDMLDGRGVDLVVDLETAAYRSLGRFDHIECLSVLEHSRRPWLMAKNIERLLKKGGTLHLSVPFVWRVHAYPDDYWRFTISGIRELMKKIEWETLMHAHETLTPKNHIPVTHLVEGGIPYFGRTEIMGFGVKS